MRIKVYLLVLIGLFSWGASYSQSLSSGKDYRDPFISVLPVKEDPKVKFPKTTRKGKVSLPPLGIEGILWGGDNPQTIINGEVYRVGDTIKGVEAKILRIEKNTVLISYGDRIFTMGTKTREEK